MPLPCRVSNLLHVEINLTFLSFFFFWGIIFISCFHTQHGSLTMLHVGMPTPARWSAAAQIHTERERERECGRKRERAVEQAMLFHHRQTWKLANRFLRIFLSSCSIVAFVMLFLWVCAVLLLLLGKYFANFLNI